MDVTAYNDFGAPGPRDKNFHLKDDHQGSLDTLKNLRKNKDRYICQLRLDQAEGRALLSQPWKTCSFHSNKPKGKVKSLSKTSYITNLRQENTVRRDESEEVPRMFSSRKY